MKSLFLSTWLFHRHTRNVYSLAADTVCNLLYHTCASQNKHIEYTHMNDKIGLFNQNDMQVVCIPIQIQSSDESYQMHEAGQLWKLCMWSWRHSTNQHSLQLSKTSMLSVKMWVGYFCHKKCVKVNLLSQEIAWKWTEMYNNGCYGLVVTWWLFNNHHAVGCALDFGNEEQRQVLSPVPTTIILSILISLLPVLNILFIHYEVFSPNWHTSTDWQQYPPYRCTPCDPK